MTLRYWTKSHFRRTPAFNGVRFRCDANFNRQANMSSIVSMLARVAAVAATLLLSSHAFAQSDTDADPEMQVQQLQERLRTLTGQNEELQHRNQILEEQLRQLQAGGPPAASRPNVAAAPPVQLNSGYQQPQPGYQQPQPGYQQQPYERREG